MVGAHAGDRDLVLLGELREHGQDARVDAAGLHVRDAGVVEHDVVVLEQRQGLRRRLAAAAGALGAELAGVDRPARRGRGRGRRGRLGHRRRGGRGGGRRCGLRVLEQPFGLLELGLVAVAVLLGGALDVGDPLAVPAGSATDCPAASREA